MTDVCTDCKGTGKDPAAPGTACRLCAGTGKFCAVCWRAGDDCTCENATPKGGEK
jgi:hypothetical protein